MTEELKNLIEKIQEEGVQAAEDKAKQIEGAAKREAEAILAKAGKDAQALIEEAKRKAKREEEAGLAGLKQAGRDLLIALRKEINAVLDKIVVSHVKEALAPDETARIITALVKNYSQKEKADIIISVNKEDLGKIEKALIRELKDETKKGITLTASEDTRAGFTISYDAGKSHYDFTDKALAEYIGAGLKPKLAEMLKG